MPFEMPSAGSKRKEELDLEKSRTLAEADLLRAGAEYIDTPTEILLNATEAQKGTASTEMERDFEVRTLKSEIGVMKQEIDELNEAVQKSKIEEHVRQKYNLGTTSEAKAFIEKRVLENEKMIRSFEARIAGKDEQPSTQPAPETAPQEEQTITEESKPVQEPSVNAETGAGGTASRSEGVEKTISYDSQIIKGSVENSRWQIDTPYNKEETPAQPEINLDEQIDDLERIKSEVSYTYPEYHTKYPELKAALEKSEAAGYMWVEDKLHELKGKKELLNPGLSTLMSEQETNPSMFEDVQTLEKTRPDVAVEFRRLLEEKDMEKVAEGIDRLNKKYGANGPAREGIYRELNADPYFNKSGMDNIRLKWFENGAVSFGFSANSKPLRRRRGGIVNWFKSLFG